MGLTFKMSFVMSGRNRSIKKPKQYIFGKKRFFFNRGRSIQKKNKYLKKRGIFKKKIKKFSQKNLQNIMLRKTSFQNFCKKKQFS